MGREIREYVHADRGSGNYRNEPEPDSRYRVGYSLGARCAKCARLNVLSYDIPLFRDHWHMKIRLVAILAVILAPLTVHAQDSRATIEATPQMAVTGRGEVKVSPDRAPIQGSVQTRAATAAAAAAE